MDRQEKFPGASFFALILTASFFAAALWLSFGAGATADYTISTQKNAREETVQERLPVEINTASAAELETLTGIGPALAERIVAYREEHGPFSAAEELLEVNGIGRSKLEDFAGEITIGGVRP